MGLMPHVLIFSKEETMLYRIGTEREVEAMKDKLPAQVYEDLLTGIVVLESEYGTDRDYTMVGGYSVVLEDKEDLAVFKRIINYEEHPCEWAVRESRGCGYLNALYIINDDFSIMVYMPIAIAPEAILKDLED